MLATRKAHDYSGTRKEPTTRFLDPYGSIAAGGTNQLDHVSFTRRGSFKFHDNVNIPLGTRES